MCFQCKNWGHIGAQCPESRVLHATSAEHPAPACVPALYAMGEVFNSPVRLLLDSGADHSIVSSGLLKQLKTLGVPVPQPSTSIALTGVHGDTTRLPVVNLSCKLLDAETKVPMAISSNIGHDIILGRNCAALFALMRAAMDETPHEALPVQTRHQAAAENIASNDLDLDSDPLDDLLGPDYEFPQTNLALPDPDDQTQMVADEDAVVAANAVSLAADQKKDPSLAPLWKTATKYKVLKNFYWPGIGQDITKFCKACDRCQRTAKHSSSKAPLVITAPPISRPFHKVATDVVGPLPLTPRKNRYILTYIDLGSRYPEAVPLRTTTSRVVADALLTIMSRLSVPSEILSDRGSNFLSSVMRDAFDFLGIHHSKTAPYRPQSNGAVERFHQTLMQMVRRFDSDQRNWDDCLPYLLFACREAPCSATGFSPFELIFGKQVRGPLDILRQSWMPSKTTKQSSAEWLLELRDDLTEMRKLAADRQEHRQQSVKEWYDSTVKERHFNPGDQVMVFTPAITGSRGEKLADRWSGPYMVIGRLSPVTYTRTLHGHWEALTRHLHH